MADGRRWPCRLRRWPEKKSPKHRSTCAGEAFRSCPPSARPVGRLCSVRSHGKDHSGASVLAVAHGRKKNLPELAPAPALSAAEAQQRACGRHFPADSVRHDRSEKNSRSGSRPPGTTIRLLSVAVTLISRSRGRCTTRWMMPGRRKEERQSAREDCQPIATGAASCERRLASLHPFHSQQEETRITGCALPTPAQAISRPERDRSGPPVSPPVAVFQVKGRFSPTGPTSTSSVAAQRTAPPRLRRSPARVPPNRPAPRARRGSSSALLDERQATAPDSAEAGSGGTCRKSSSRSTDGAIPRQRARWSWR